MKPIERSLPVVLLLAATLAVGCGNSKAESNPTVKRENIVSVKVETVEWKEFSETIKLTGTVESANDIVVPAEESGTIVRWFVDKGAPVTKGQVIAQIDDAMQKSSFEAAEANFKMAEVNFEKQKKAFEEQAISELQLKNLEFQRDAAKAQADAARQRLDKTKVLSPIDGVVNDRFADEGEMIGAGMPLAHVVDVYHLKVNLGVPERYAADLKVGSSVTFIVDSYPDEIFSGKITFVAPSVNPDNRTIPAEVSVTGAMGRLKPQMIARVNLRLATVARAVVIPADCIQQVDMNKSVVYVVSGDTAEERVVRIDGSDGNRVRIIDGLSPGDQLVVVGFQNLVNKQKITIQP